MRNYVNNYEIHKRSLRKELRSTQKVTKQYEELRKNYEILKRLENYVKNYEICIMLRIT